MCGRFGSTLTVCAWPTWRVRPISVGRRRIRDVDDLEAALRGARTPSVALVVAAAGAVGGVEDDLRVARDDVRVRELDERLALGRRLGVVLEARHAGRGREAARGRVAGDVLRIDLALLVGQLDDVLTRAVRAAGERADGGVRDALAREEVEVGVRIPGGNGGDELPLGVLAAGVDAARERRGLGEGRAARGRGRARPRCPQRPGLRARRWRLPISCSRCPRSLHSLGIKHDCRPEGSGSRGRSARARPSSSVSAIPTPSGSGRVTASRHTHSVSGSRCRWSVRSVLMKRKRR